ncbi:unnamed protein product [Notodromas monacha]|uniref:Dynamin-binding protein n=1 Tax=Notodromas monacha TaxID=399045 RepID=A0A7R9GDI0_9CRUS|nr:unnamed protein product [Notodromas monacha]CAG0917222.1 unnamed protein product [Notodromas monacha]
MWIARAVYDFRSASDSEVSLVKGDIVQVHDAPEGDGKKKHWVRGTVYGRGEGNVPTSCLSRVSIPPIRASYHDGDEILIAGEGFLGTDPTQDLPFSKGEFLIGRFKLNDDWMFGKSIDGSRCGRFPLSVVMEVNPKPDSSGQATLPVSENVRCEALAAANVTAQLPGELSVRQGDRVEVLQLDGDGWYECRLDDGSTGLLSAQVLTIVQGSEKFQSNGSNPDPTDLELLAVQHDFTAEFDNELSCRKGEFVYVKERVEGDWIRVQAVISGNVGLVPASFLGPASKNASQMPAAQEAPDVQIATPSVPKVNQKFLRVLYDFEPQHDGDLRLKAGSLLELISYTDDEHWLRARDSESKVEGMCPAAFVTDETAEPSKSTPARGNSFNAADFAVAVSSKRDPSGVNIDARIERNLLDISLNSPRPNVRKSPSPQPVFPSAPETSSASPTSRYDNLHSAFVGHDSDGLDNDLVEELTEKPKPLPRRSPPKPSFPPAIPRRPSPVKPPREPKAELGEVSNHLPANLEEPMTEDFGNVIGSETPQSVRSSHSNSDSLDSSSFVEEGAKVMSQRDHVVKEILTAERDFIKHLKIAAEVFGLPFAPALEEHGMSSKAIFGNFLEVIEVAEKLERALTVNIDGVEPSKQRIGSCFIALKGELEEVYLKYCLHYSKVTATLATYMAVMKRKETLDELAYNIRSRGVNCISVGSILVEPVQHVLKYHLLLAELIKATEEGHEDLVDLWEAQRLALERNTKINETGRLTEILEKYSRNASHRSSVSGRISNVSMHSISKSAGRLATSLATSMGLASETKCAVFDERGKRFRDIDECIKAFKKWVLKFVAEFDSVLKLELALCEGLRQLFGAEKKPEEVERFWGVHYEIYSRVWPNFERQLGVQVITPLGILSETLDRPRFLMEKRRNKLLDYDKARNKYVKAKEQTMQMKEEMDTAEKTYAALNALLIEELPTVCDICHEVVSRCFLNFFVIRKKLCGAIFKELISLSEMPLLASGHSNIYDSFFTKHKLVCNQMSRFSLLSIKFSDDVFASNQNSDSVGMVPRLPRRFSKSSHDQKPVVPSRQFSAPEPIQPAVERMNGASERSSGASLSDSESVRMKYPAEKVYLVMRDFPEEKEDTTGGGILPAMFVELVLKVKKDDVVGVVKRELPSGGSSHWFIDNGVSQGFVPHQILQPECQRRASTLTPSRGAPSVTSQRVSVSPSINQSHLYDDPPPPSYDEVVCLGAEGVSPKLYPENKSLEVQNVDVRDKSPLKPKAANSSQARVMFEYKADTEVELSVSVGETLTVMHCGDNAGNKDWMYVENGFGKRGYVPTSYVQLLE